MLVNRSLDGEQLIAQEEQVSRDEESDSESEEDMEESSPDESSVSVDEVTDTVLEDEEEQIEEEVETENIPIGVLEPSTPLPSIVSDISSQQSNTVDAISEAPPPKKQRIEVVERNQGRSSKQDKASEKTPNKSRAKATKGQNTRGRRVRGKELTQEQKDEDYEG